MRNSLFIFVCLFSSALLSILPMSKKNYDFGDNVCHYRDNSIEYVKPCPEGQYCQTTETNNKELSTCQPRVKLAKSLGETCEASEECEGDLKCRLYHLFSEKKCLYENDHYFLKNNYYYCIDGHYLYNTSSLNLGCYEYLPESITEDMYERTYYTIYPEPTYFIPGPYKMPGIITFSYSDYNVITYIEKAYIGSIDIGNMVGDYRACKSGFAIKTYGNGNLDPDDDSLYKLFYKCAEVHI